MAIPDPKPSFLVVEDEPMTAEIVQAVLAPLGEVRLAGSGGDALDLLRHRLADIVLLDISLPDIDGHDLLPRILALPGAEACAVIFVTAKTEAQEQIRGFGGGAVDYIVKPVVPEVLRARIAHHLQRLAEARRVRHLADYDDLTGLLNRRRFFERLAAEIQRAERHRRPLVLVTFDIDHFKQVNDGFGHDVGDALLRQVGEGSRARLRRPDCVGRIGGEEFAILLPETDPAGGRRVAEDLRSHIAALQLEANGCKIGVTSSFGVAAFVPGDTLESLRKRADEALYRSKQSGRNRVTVS